MNLGFIYALSAAIVWGLAYTIDEKILRTISPIALLFAHSIITAILLLPFIFSNSSPLKTLFSSSVSTLSLTFATIVLATLGNFLILTSIKNSSAATASIIEIAYPFFVVLFSYLIFRSTPNIYFLIGGILIALGSIIILKLA